MKYSIFIICILALTGCKKETIKNTDKNISSADTVAAAVSRIDTTMKISESYARLLARDIYFWAWPMVNIYNRRLAFEQAPKAGLMNGVLPFAPVNKLSMLHDYIEPAQRWVACPNQDVVYGAAVAALDVSPLIIQIPDFGDRFWVYQVVDLRSDSFAKLGKMYNTKPGFYLLVGPGWKGEVPDGITKVFRSRTQTGFVVPRIFQDDNQQDRAAIQKLINQIDVYPLSEFNGKMKTNDWSKLPVIGSPLKDAKAGETKWVFPDKFLEQLEMVLKDAQPLPSENVKYAQARQLINAVKKDSALKNVVIEELKKAEEELIDPLLQFRNWGSPLKGNWTTINNGAAFGTDYFTRTAVAKSNILVNSDKETKYFYQDLDASAQRLNGRFLYTINFPKGQTPPVEGFWSITMYDDHHFFVSNAIKRYSLGTKNKSLKFNTDGSLTIYIQADAPNDNLQSNWLPAPKGDFSLYIRAYWPKEEIIKGAWTPPLVERKSM